MFKLNSGQTLAQATKFDKSPQIVNFVKTSHFVEPPKEQKSTSIIYLGK